MNHLRKTILFFFLFAPAYGQNPSVPVHFSGTDGFRLKGNYYEAAAPGPGILLLHQCDREGPLTGFENLATKLAQRGFHVLMFDFRGYGESRNNQFTGENWQEAGKFFPTDTEAAYRFLISQPKVIRDRIGVGGASCGGRRAILLAGEHPEIKTLALISGSARDPIQEALRTIQDRPVLCVVSQQDSAAVRAMKRVFDNSTSPESRCITYKGSLHGTPLFSHDEHLEQTLVDWYEKYLR